MKLLHILRYRLFAKFGSTDFSDRAIVLFMVLLLSYQNTTFNKSLLFYDVEQEVELEMEIEQETNKVTCSSEEEYYIPNSYLILPKYLLANHIPNCKNFFLDTQRCEIYSPPPELSLVTDVTQFIFYCLPFA